MPENTSSANQPAANKVPAAGGQDKDVESNKALAAISYLYWISLIMYLVKKDSKFVQFHARQGMMIAIIITVIWVLVAAMTPFFLLGGFFLIMIFNVIDWIFVILAIVGLIQAATGKWWKIPVIGDWAFKLFGQVK